MKERPILFSAPMVRAILNGRKTQTRRVVKPQPGGFTHVDHDNDRGWHVWWDVAVSGIADGQVEQRYEDLNCPYGIPGDRLWVKETWWMHDDPNAFDCGNVAHPDGTPRTVGYAATMDGDSVRVATEYGCRKRVSIHMPRWASRITLEVIGVRVERLQEITLADVRAEGIPETYGDSNLVASMFPEMPPHEWDNMRFDEQWKLLWESINGPGSWAANPWVWVVEFKRINP